MSYRSETWKYRDIILPLLPPGNGIDIGSGGDPIKVDGCVSWDAGGAGKADVDGAGINFYAPEYEIDSVFESEVFDWVYSSHLLEDFQLSDWIYVLNRWTRILAAGGTMIILVPDRDAYHAHTPVGANQNHRHEPVRGELTAFFAAHYPAWVTEERFLEPYTIMLVARKPL